ncbi:hypothetical protein Palpr_2656 [Paludibacter propionicigenes WB4]|uniref:Uncharacterized protein n=1 Tax=Paludibacter propionicigenes (strain DSM 17365 / JCM 13257 / WB4) TaxID=694427 RepID=E4T7U2_PALPW|nr:hypothetical protein Palpr_2656 [Paludibacter propionicigenes WB4]
MYVIINYVPTKNVIKIRGYEVKTTLDNKNKERGHNTRS